MFCLDFDEYQASRDFDWHGTSFISTQIIQPGKIDNMLKLGPTTWKHDITCNHFCFHLESSANWVVKIKYKFPKNDTKQSITIRNFYRTT